MPLSSDELASKISSFSAGLAKLDTLSGTELLAQATQLARIENAYAEQARERLIQRRVAIVGSFSTQHLVRLLRLFLYREKIQPIVHEAGFDSVISEILDPKSKLHVFKPEFLIALPHHGDLKDFPVLFAPEEQVEGWVTETAKRYEELWRNVASRSPGCQILQGTFVAPIARQLGNLEANYLFSETTCIELLNLELKRRKPAHVTLVDSNYLASYLGKSRWFDEVGYFVSKQDLAKLIAAFSGRVRKCLVLDLDQTLWGGVIGDDGVSGINVDPEHPLGEAFLAFQAYVKKLKERGVLLAVCSKNDEETARLPFAEHGGMLLKMGDFVAFQANWDDKATNLMRISKTLGIGLDSLVFFDDNPAERALVRQFTPEVEVVEVPADPALFVRALETACCFEWGQLSREDTRRSEGYLAERRREELRTTAFDYDSYLRSLELKAQVKEVYLASLPRFSQLINKSNQFNLRTQRYTQAQLSKMLEARDRYRLLQISVSDRFTDYGLISCIIVEKRGDRAFLDTWVMSCRVLKRGVENLAINQVMRSARELGCTEVVGEYIETQKNGLVKELYPSLGFSAVDEGYYCLRVESFREQSHHIEVSGG